MAASLDERIRSIFTADTTDFVRGVEQVNRSLDSNIKKEREAQRVRERLVGNIRGGLLDPSGAAQAGLSKLVGGLKSSALSIGILGAEGAALVKTFRASSALAGEQAQKMNALAEEMRRSSAINVFASSADGVESLSAKLAGCARKSRLASWRSARMIPTATAAASSAIP